MKLSSKARKAVLVRKTYYQLAIDLDKSANTIKRWAEENRENNPLINAGNILIVSRRTGLKLTEILQGRTSEIKEIIGVDLASLEEKVA